MMINAKPDVDSHVVLKSKKRMFTLTGMVVQDVLDKTITVSVVNKFRHSIYQKTIFKTKKYLVHDAQNQAKIGDQVLIANVRKLSARKSFYLVKVLERKKGDVPSPVSVVSEEVKKQKLVEKKPNVNVVHSIPLVSPTTSPVSKVSQGVPNENKTKSSIISPVKHIKQKAWSKFVSWWKKGKK